MQRIFRVVIAGPVGSGKSTLIRSISEIDVVDTDRAATDETATLKPKTTVAMDFGRLSLGENMWLHLYGTPGQARFNFMWDLLIRRAHGYVLLVPAHCPKVFREARAIKLFMQQRVELPLVVGVTHTDHPKAWDPDDIRLTLADEEQISYPTTVVDPRDPASVASSLLLMVEQLAGEAAAMG